VVDTSDLDGQVLVADDVPITVTDGTRLSARVFRPDADGTYPVIMAFTSYGKDRGPEEYPPVLDYLDREEFNMGTFEVSSWTT
jgi:predicted acyl esterase